MTKILVADCEPMTSNALRGILNALGFTAYATTDPNEALNIARCERPDVVIMDVRLGSYDALRLDIIEEVKKINNNVKIIIMSTYYEDTEEFDRIKACNIDRYYNKPVSADVIINEIKRLTRIS